MGREVKFRAWDGQMMHCPVVMHPSWGAVKPAYNATGWSDEAKAGVPMQFTGLKDRNGAEIYEGDVLDYKGIKTRVEWDVLRARFIEVARGETFSSIDNRAVEVIGNVFQHPHLMQDQPRSNDGPA